MKKLIKLILVMGILVLTGCVGEKNQIPKQYLGNYELLDSSAKITEQGTVINNEQEFCVGKASLIENGDRYILKVERKPTESYLAQEKVETFLNYERDNLEMNAKVKKIVEEKGDYVEKYMVDFWDVKITGIENTKYNLSVWNKLTWEPRIWFEKINGRYIMSIGGTKFIKK